MTIDRKYTIQPEQVNDPVYSCPSNCNEIMFVNTGATTVLVNKFPIIAGAFITFGGNAGEMDVTVYKVEANTSGGLWVFRKIFKDTEG